MSTSLLGQVLIKFSQQMDHSTEILHSFGSFTFPTCPQVLIK